MGICKNENIPKKKKPEKNDTTSRDRTIGFFFGYIFIFKYTHFFKIMGILQMGIFSVFRKNGYIQMGIPFRIFYISIFWGKIYIFYYYVKKKNIANGYIYEILKRMGILKWVYKRNPVLQMGIFFAIGYIFLIS